MIVTTFQVKNMSHRPIARLTIEEFWYDKAGNPVTGDKQFLKKPLMPGEIADDRSQHADNAEHGPEQLQVLAPERRQSSRSSSPKF